MDLVNVAHLATFASDCTEASQKYYQQEINFAADLQFLVNAVESTVTSLDGFSYYISFTSDWEHEIRHRSEEERDGSHLVWPYVAKRWRTVAEESI